MKKSELIFNVISVPVDFLMILAAASLAYFLRYELETIPVLFNLTYQQYFKLILLPAIFLLLLLALFGLYHQKSTRGFWHEAGRVIGAVSAGLMIVVVLFFFNQRLFPSRLIILMSWVLVIVLVALARLALLLIQRQMLLAGRGGLHRLLVIKGGNRNPAVEEIQRDPKLGYQIIAQLSYSGRIGEEIESLHRKQRIDELLQADSALNNEQVLRLVDICQDLGIKFNYLPGILESHRANIETDVIGTLPVIRLKGTPLDGWGKVVKRMLDILVSASGLILTAPLFALISLAIKLDSAGPVFFHQRRGSSFHDFEFYKFRTMHSSLSEGTEQGDRIRALLEKQNVRLGPYVKLKNDPRVTRIGRFLRKTKLDELPQLWHILRGQMSLVGPRIHMISEVAHFERGYKKVFTTIKPGATGLAQLSQFYNPELPFEEEIKLDLFYIENWSIWLDIYIIFKTLVLLLTKRPRADY